MRLDHLLSRESNLKKSESDNIRQVSQVGTLKWRELSGSQVKLTRQKIKAVFYSVFREWMEARTSERSKPEGL